MRPAVKTTPRDQGQAPASAMGPLVLCVSLWAIPALSADFSDWQYYKQIQINTSATGANLGTGLSDYPLLVRLGGSDFDFSQAQSAGEDLRFSDPDGNELQYEIEDWDNMGEAATVWVKCDTIYADSATQYVLMYWGNATAGGRTSASAVFDTANGYRGVYHYNEDPGNDASDAVRDRTHFGFHGTTSGGMNSADLVSSQIGNGLDFDGGNDVVDFGTRSEFDMTTFSISGWFQTTNKSNYKCITSKNSNSTNRTWWVTIWNGTGQLTFRTSSGGSVNVDIKSSGDVADGSFHHFAAVLDGTTVAKLYLDGAEAGSRNNPGVPNLPSVDALSGNDPSSGGRYFEGIIDELRFANVAYAADRVRMDFKTQETASTVITFGETQLNELTYHLWDGGGADNRWSTAENWSGDLVPDSTKGARFDGTSIKRCSLDVAGHVKALSFESSYSGTFCFTDETLKVVSVADFDGGESIEAGTGVLELAGSASFTPKSGETFPCVRKAGSGTATIYDHGLSTPRIVLGSGTLHLGAALAHAVGGIGGTGGIHFGSSTVSVTGAAVDLSGISSLSAAGGTLEFEGSSAQTFTPKSGTTHPAILHSGPDTLRLSTNKLIALSFLQTAGTLDLDGCDVETAGDFSIADGTAASFDNLGGRTITVGGNAVFVGGQSDLINLDAAAAWTIDVTGGLDATYCTIGSSNATGSTGYASSSVDGGGNTNWVFDMDDYGDWAYRRRIYLNTTSCGAPIDADVSTFPLLIRLDGTNFDFSQAASDGRDIRFSSTEGFHLVYEKEYWSQAGSRAALWVRVPVVEAGNKTQGILMYWGNGAAADKSNPSAAFQTANGFQGVWHLNDDILDATSNSNDGFETGGTYTSAGYIEGGRSYAGSHYDSIPDDNSLDNTAKLTVSAWVYPTVLNGQPDALVSKRISYNSNLAYSLFFYGGSQMDFYIEGSGDAFYGNTVYSTNTWYYVTLVYDGTAGGSQRASVYVNGDHDITTRESSSSISNHASPLYFGMLDRTKGNGLHGTLDEVRVENTARSADWILLCYKTQHMGTRAVNHLCPVVSGPGDTVEVSARQEDADTVRIRFEAEDPQSATVTVTAQYKTVAGGSWTALTNTAGDIGAGIDTSATTDREIRWSAGDQLGNVEGSYLVRVIGFDGAWYDTTESSAFDLDCRDPSGLGSFTCTDTVSSSVTLSWDAASDANFDHYEIWYGTDQGKVQNRDGSGADGALEWDDGDQANLADAATTAATITGLSTATSYYFKIWAADDFGNESTVPDINITTLNLVAPVWSRSSLGAVTGGSIAEEVLYLGSGAEKVYSIAVSDGGTRWTYSSINGVPGMPTYNYSGGEYRVFFSAGTHVIGLRDDGGGYSALFTPIDLGDTCGTPYAGPDDSTFHVCYGGNLTKRKVSDGSVVSGWPTAVTNLSEAADMAVFNDEVYVGTTDGKVCKVDADGTPLGYSGGFAGSPRVDLPLLVRGGTVYVAPAAGKLYALNSSDLSEKWNVDLLSSNTGASFTAGNGVLYVACGHYVQRVTDEGGTASADWAFDAGGTVASGPVASTDSIVYFGRNGGQYYAVDDGGTAADTVSNWPYSAAVGDADSGPWVDQTNTRVVFATANGHLHAFSME